MKLEINEKNRERMPLEEPFERVISPLQVFINSQSAAGFLLLISTVIALFLANSGWHEQYVWLTNFKIGFIWGEGQLYHSAVDWVTEGLIVLFFFLLGLEIKFQCIAGELKEAKSSILAVSMALGGMVVPALTYLITMSILGGNDWQGWGIVMATDTAFALGLLVLLGARVPKSVLVLITALAIVDDIGAVLVIGLFYTDNVSLVYLGYGAIVLTLMFIANSVGIRAVWFYIFAGVILWWFVSHSGVHATTAGILAALTVPTKPIADTNWFAKSMERLITRFKRIDHHDKTILEQQKQHELAQAAEVIVKSATTPVQRWQSKLHSPISLLVLPLFALLNAGIVLPESSAEIMSMPVFWSCMLGLFIGKPLGIFLFSYVFIKLGWAERPTDMQWHDFIALGCFAGIGFTMSLFITNLAFIGDIATIEKAKLGIICGSLFSAIIGFVLFTQFKKQRLAS